MIYEYKCQKCDYTFEEILKMDQMYEPTLRVCPRCREYAVKKQVSASTFVINGYSEKNGYSKK